MHWVEFTRLFASTQYTTYLSLSMTGFGIKSYFIELNKYITYKVGWICLYIETYSYASMYEHDEYGSEISIFLLQINM